MKIHSTRFGTQEINPDDVLTFPLGILGFENCTRYKLFHEDKEQPVVHWLQSIDDPDVAFSVVDPARFGLNYEIVLTDEEVAMLKAENESDIAVMLIAYKPQTDVVFGANVSANINGPVIINTRDRLGLQKTLVGLKADITLKGGQAA
ncbi:MAG: flagellar assembly protein FliW [Sulfuricella sp.]|nr:flagellar assembly protein FliW [Sulfuricella sp.]